MTIKLANNAVSRLAAALGASDTALSVQPGDGAKFPALSSGDTFPLTLVKADGSLEIVTCTDKTTDVFTITRGQENTTPIAFSTGDRVELRLTAATLDAKFTAPIATAQAGADASLKKESNLSDLTDKAAARSNLEFGTAALASEEALATNYAGADEPATTWAYMTWKDTTNNVVKMRNADNDDWIVVGSLGINAGTDYAGTEPPNPLPYMRWADTANNALKRRKADNSDWVVIGGLFTDSVPLDGSKAMTAALKVGTASYQTDGNIYGSVWGSGVALSTYIANQLAAKYNVNGGTINGSVAATGTISANGRVSGLNFAAGGPPAPSSQGLHWGWNEPSGTGRARIVCNKGDGDGGFSFEIVDSGNTAVLQAWKFNADGNASFPAAGTVLGVSNFLSWYGSQGAGAVGTLAFLYAGSALTQGQAAAGSDLRWAGIVPTGMVYSGSNYPVGSWRCLGYTNTGGATLFIRYA